MGWDATYVAEGHFVETTYEGVIAPDELNTAVVRTLALAHSHQTTLFLADCSQLVGGHSLVDLSHLIDSLVVLGMVGHLKEALIMPHLRAAAHDVAFWEAACVNRGLLVRLFPERQTALDWLCSPPHVAPIPSAPGRA